MEVKNNAVFTGAIIGKPKLRKTKFGKNYVMFDFQTTGLGAITTIPCVCWNSDLAEYLVNNVNSNEYLIITGHLSEYTKQHKLQLVLESFDYTEVPAYDKNGVNHVHLRCPIVSKSIKVYNDIEYTILKLETAENKYCLCTSFDSKYIAKLKNIELETQLITRTWADISGILVTSGKLVNNTDEHTLAINMGYLNIIPEYDQEALQEALLDAAYDYDPIFDAD